MKRLHVSCPDLAAPKRINDLTRSQAFRRLLMSFATVAALATIVPERSHAQTASFQGLGFFPGGTNSSANGVNAAGTVVAGYGDATGVNQEAFRWQGGIMTGLGSLNGSQSVASAVNSSGSVVVGNSYDPSASQYPIVWTNGSPTTLAFAINPGAPPPQICGTQVLGVNGDGTVVVGQDALTPGGGGSCPPGRAVQWLNGAESLLFPDPSSNPPGGLAEGVSADGSVIVGRVGDSSCSCSRAFRWTGGSGTILGDFGGNSSLAYAANSDGSVVVGTAAVDIIHSQPFRWTAATGLVGFGGIDIFSEARAVSADGAVVVGKVGNPGRAFRWMAATGLQYIDDLLTAAGVDFTGWSLVQATGISADGTVIVGNGVLSTQGEAWIARLPRPNPATNLFAAVLPNARTSFFPGGPPVTGFASIINNGTATATACSIVLPFNAPATSHYQRTNAQNVPIGSQDTPVDIAPGATQTFVFSITPLATFAQEIALVFSCTNTNPAPVTFGVNTFLVSAGSAAVPDMLSIAATSSNDGIANIPGTTGTGFIVTAAINIGAAGTVVFTPSVTPVGQTPRNVPVNLSICQTNSQGLCINPATPGSSATLTANPNDTVFFSIFIQGQGTAIPFDPGNMRVFIIGKQGSTPVGEASEAVRTQ